MHLKEELYDLIKTDKRFFDFIQKNDLDGLWYLDLENTENVWMNDKFLRILGYNPTEMLSTSSAWQKIISQDDLKASIDAFIEHSKNIKHPYDQVLRYTHKNCSTVGLRCQGMLIYDEDGKAIRILGAHQNVNETKSGQIANSLFNLNTVFVVRVDFEGNYKYANKTFLDKFGYLYKKNKEGILGLSSFNSIIPEDLPKVQTAVELLLSQPERSIVVDIRKPLSDGTIANTLWDFACIFNAKGQPVEIQCIGIDETDRYEAYKHLEQTTKLLNEAQLIANIGAWEHDLSTGKIFWTDEVYNIHEVDKDFDHNKVNGIEFYHSDDRPLIYQAIEDCISKQNSFDLRCRFITAKGNMIWVRSCGHPVVSDGKTTHIIGVIQDINKQKQTENLLQKKNEELNNINKELIAAKEKAEESDRLKSAFLANMSHEIRTPMNGILGFTELLLEPNLGSEEQEEYIQIVHKSGQRMLNTVNDIVEISKIETGLVNLNIEEIDINDRVEELYHFFDPEAKKKNLKLNLEILLPEKKKKLLTDHNKLDSILTNLIKNAIKYTNAGTITIGCIAKGNTIEFYIKDTGIGIPMNRIEAIFNRFEQADIEDKRAAEGSGLGLTIAKSYVEMLGGKIWVESEKGKGSTFFFTVPYNEDLKNKVSAPARVISEKQENIIPSLL